MNTTVYSNNEIMGNVYLNISDESMGVLSGVFEPHDNYKKIRDTIWEFNDEVKNKDFKKLETLRLNAQLENGYFLFPMGGITIWDVKEHANEPIQIDIVGVFRHVIEDCFLNNELALSLSEPWDYLSIEQKIAFEDELYNEIGDYRKKSIFDFIKLNNKHHVLFNSSFSAIANTGMNDDVLFAINKKGVESNYVIVHLTWSGKKDKNPNWPSTNFHKTFSDFKTNKMLIDKFDWEN